jgi:hypothetical protein
LVRYLMLESQFIFTAIISYNTCFRYSDYIKLYYVFTLFNDDVIPRIWEETRWDFTSPLTQTLHGNVETLSREYNLFRDYIYCRENIFERKTQL